MYLTIGTSDLLQHHRGFAQNSDVYSIERASGGPAQKRLTGCILTPRPRWRPAVRDGLCLDCADGEVTCSYGGATVTEMSCGGCHALSTLYNQLCDSDSGITDTSADIEAGLLCE